MSKLDTYSLIKTTFGPEMYLFLYNKAHRQYLSQFRTSAHTLEIEWGRWRRREREARLCLFCNTNTVETEMHALLQCPKHNDDRLEFYEYILQNNIQNIQDSLNETQLFIEILTCLDTGVLQALGKFVAQIFKNRLDHDDISIIEISLLWA